MIDLKRTTTGDCDFVHLIRRLDDDLWRRYPQTQQNFTAHNLMPSDAHVLVAYLAGKPVGCGCFREAEAAGTVEIKRMYVTDQARGQGIAAHILAELEKWAAEEGKITAVLETGVNQPEAIALYTKAGYQRIPNYGPYADHSESVCMAKRLS